MMKRGSGVGLLVLGLAWVGIGIANIIRTASTLHDELAMTVVARMWLHIAIFVLPGFLLAMYGSQKRVIRRDRRERRAWEDAQ